MKSDSPLRILHVVLSLEPGGMENGVVNLANALDARDDFEVHVACLEREGAFAERIENRAQVHALGKEPGFSIGCVLALRRLLRELRPDIVHTHNLGPLIYASLASCCRSHAILHGEHGALKGDDLRRKRLLQRRFFFGRVRAILTVSEGLKRDLEAHGLPGGAKITAIPNGVDARRFSPGDGKARARESIGLPSSPGEKVIGIVGRFDPVKRHTLLLEAFERVAEKSDADLWLLIVGDGGAAAGTVKERIEASPLRSRIRAVGHQADPLPFYRSMDLMALPSEHEGMSNALLEAMACGVPVLASTACGCGEVIENGRDGILADIDGAESLAGALSRALESPERLSQLAANARRKIEGEFSMNSMAQHYADYYYDLLKLERAGVT